jgi:uncharacterized damage-inducible protein DinB
MDRTRADSFGDEPTQLAQWLDYHRATLVTKASGLTREQLNTRLGPSTLTLAGLLKHMALVEDGWFQETLLGAPMPEPWASAPFDDDRDWDFTSAVDDEPDELLALYAGACERSRAAVRQVRDLDAPAAGLHPKGHRYNLRWILLHMIEETARHNGHADLLRENVDGETGD